MTGDMQFHKDIKIGYLEIGDEKSPLFVVDNFVSQPNSLVNSAIDASLQGSGFQSQASDFYPGIRKTSPAEYQTLLNKLDKLILPYIPGTPSSNVNIIMSAFSIATTPEQNLRPIQTIPHFDSPDPLQYALVHYLCDQQYGGTSFYQHNATGFERITEAKVASYGRTIKQQAIAEQLHKQPKYINGDTRLFTRIQQVEASFNRAIIYPSNLLHSGNIQAHLGLKPSPQHGRLTISSFLKLS